MDSSHNYEGVTMICNFKQLGFLNKVVLMFALISSIGVYGLQNIVYAAPGVAVLAAAYTGSAIGNTDLMAMVAIDNVLVENSEMSQDAMVTGSDNYNYSVTDIAEGLQYFNEAAASYGEKTTGESAPESDENVVDMGELATALTGDPDISAEDVHGMESAFESGETVQADSSGSGEITVSVEEMTASGELGAETEQAPVVEPEVPTVDFNPADAVHEDTVNDNRETTETCSEGYHHDDDLNECVVD